MKKQVLTLIIFTLFVFSCTNLKEKDDNAPSGTEGLTLELYTSNYLLFAEQGSELPFTIKITNKGWSKAENIVLTASGYDESLISVTFNDKIPNEIEGKSMYMKVSIPEIVSGNIKLKDVNVIKEDFSFNILFNLCYKYKTIFYDSFCVEPLNTINLRRKVCSALPKEYSKGQGAPLVITKIEPTVTNNKIIVTYTIEKRSGTEIYYLDSSNNKKCGIINYKELRRFKVISTSIGDTESDNCKNKEFYLDESGKRTKITCTYPINTKNINAPYITTITLELEYYVYQSYFSPEIKVFKLE